VEYRVKNLFFGFERIAFALPYPTRTPLTSKPQLTNADGARHPQSFLDDLTPPRNLIEY
jgi:hypothetical protein